MTDSIIAQFIGLFINVDDFCLVFEPEYNKKLLEDGTRKRIRESTLSLSEVMTIIIWFHMSGYRTFKDYYIREVSIHLRWAFPQLVKYNRFVELMPQALLPLCFYFRTRKGKCSGISFVDSMPISVCHNRRIRSHKVLSNSARRGKNSMGWFYGFKTHLFFRWSAERQLSMIKENCLPFISHQAMLMIENLCQIWLKAYSASFLEIKAISHKSFSNFSMLTEFS